MSRKVGKIKSDLELDDEVHLHQIGWTIQRIGWVILFLVLLAAAAGLFGNGYLSNITLEDQYQAIEFERFGRFESSTEIKIRASSEDGKIQITIPQSYLDDVEIEKIIPEPEEQETVNDAYRFTYAFKDPAQITIYMMPKKSGRINAVFTVNSSRFNLSHYIYP